MFKKSNIFFVFIFVVVFSLTSCSKDIEKMRDKIHAKISNEYKMKYKADTKFVEIDKGRYLAYPEIKTKTQDGKAAKLSHEALTKAKFGITTDNVMEEINENSNIEAYRFLVYDSGWIFRSYEFFPNESKSYCFEKIVFDKTGEKMISDNHKGLLNLGLTALSIISKGKIGKLAGAGSKILDWSGDSEEEWLITKVASDCANLKDVSFSKEATHKKNESEEPKKQATQLNPTDAETYYNRGKAYYDKHEYDKAIENFNQTILINPSDSIAAYIHRGLAYEKKSEYDKAIEDYTLAIQINPKKYGVGYICRGDVYARKGEYNKAIEDYTLAIQIDPKYDSAYMKRGEVYYNKGDYDNAIADINRVIQINPKDDEAYGARGFVYFDKGGYDNAIADFNRAIQINPKLVGVYSYRGLSYAKKGEYDKAIADYQQAISIDPNHTEARKNLEDAIKLRNEKQQTKQEATQLNPKDAEAYYSRGNNYYNKGEYDKAIINYSQAIQINPKFDNAYYNRGYAYKQKGDYDKARTNFQQAISINPNHALAKKELESLNNNTLKKNESTPNESKILGTYKDLGDSIILDKNGVGTEISSGATWKIKWQLNGDKLTVVGNGMTTIYMVEGNQLMTEDSVYTKE